MKISTHPVHTPPAGSRPLPGGRSTAEKHGATTATAPAPTTTPAEPTVTLSSKKAPPGLQRVAARLEGLGAEGRSPGQSNALSQITRNLLRYIDMQALAPLPAVSPAPATAPTAPAMPEPVTVEAAAATTSDLAAQVPPTDTTVV